MLRLLGTRLSPAVQRRTAARVVALTQTASKRGFYSSPRLSQKQSSADDPFPLPLSNEIVHEPSSSLPPLRLERGNESDDVLRARLTYQTRKRGTLETDLLLSTFAGENLRNMSREELEAFDRLLDEPDWDIFYWSIEKRDPPERWAGSPLLEKLKVHARNEGKVVRRMPDLRA